MTLTKRPLFYWILHKQRASQIFLLAIILVSLFFKVYPLEMQRKIINIAINLKHLDLLYLYCGLYMGAVLIAGLLKYWINVLQAVIGQKILIDMRKELYQHVLQLPLQFFHKTQAGIVISALTAELNAIGSFLGGAIAIPVASFLTFIAFLGFMIYLNPLLGFLTFGLYPFEFIVIPMLQKRHNKQNRKRVKTTRSMANLVNESVSGIHEVQGNASYRLEEEKLDSHIHHLYVIMKKLFFYKYGVKFSNNLFQSIGPFLLFLIGGYLAIHGNFTIGALVAFLSAYEKVYDPWKEIIEYYQMYQDAQIRYKQIMETFDLEPEYLLEAPGEKPLSLLGKIDAKDVSYRINDDVILLEEANFTIEKGQHLALIGFSGSGKSTLSLLISQLYGYTGGSLQIDGHEVQDITKVDIARNISIVSQHPFIFTGTVRDNLLYSCTALQHAEAPPPIPSRNKILEIIKEVGLEADVLRWGFRSIIPREKAMLHADNFLKMRKIIHEELREDFERAVEFYDPHSFLEFSSIGANIIFGGYINHPEPEYLLQNQYFLAFFTNSELENQLLELGQNLAETTVTLLQDLKGDEYFFKGSPMEAHEFNLFATLMEKLKSMSADKLQHHEKRELFSLALRFIPGQHKIFTISETLKQSILNARYAFLKEIAKVDLEQCAYGTLQTQISPFMQETSQTSDDSYFPYCSSQYLYSQSLFNNVLFGNVIDRDIIRTEVGERALRKFDEQGFLDDILQIGLEFHVGSKGDNLSGGQKQKIALARAFLKNTPILILDEATASLDNSSQAKVQRYLETQLKGNTTVVAVMHRLDIISGYDNIIVMKAGKIVESGNYNDLMKAKGVLHELVSDT